MEMNLVKSLPNENKNNEMIQEVNTKSQRLTSRKQKYEWKKSKIQKRRGKRMTYLNPYIIIQHEPKTKSDLEMKATTQ